VTVGRDNGEDSSSHDPARSGPMASRWLLPAAACRSPTARIGALCRPTPWVHGGLFLWAATSELTRDGSGLGHRAGVSHSRVVQAGVPHAEMRGARTLQDLPGEGCTYLCVCVCVCVRVCVHS